MSEHGVDEGDENDGRTRAGVEDAMAVGCPRRSPEAVSDRLGTEQGSISAQEVAKEETGKDIGQSEHIDVNLLRSETLPKAKTHDDEAVDADGVSACSPAATQGMS
jgi:hypothetical protein